MKLINGGTFKMGLTAIADTVHYVTLSSFFMDSTEVTQADYQAIMKVNPSYFRGDPNRPVESITWFDAVLYCNNRSKRDGLDTVYIYSIATGILGNGCESLVGFSAEFSKNGYRLPTDAQWEYACRAGSTTDYWWGPDTVGRGIRVWWAGNSGDSTHPVATKLANAWGIYDMAGNVYEWCYDYCDAGTKYGSIAQTDPTGPLTGLYHVIRGGSWGRDDEFAFCSAGYSEFFPSNWGSQGIGFRVVLPK
jgi:formylglycine-generating enzyme required for sulfatase activity